VKILGGRPSKMNLVAEQGTKHQEDLRAEKDAKEKMDGLIEQQKQCIMALAFV